MTKFVPICLLIYSPERKEKTGTFIGDLGGNSKGDSDHQFFSKYF